MILKSLKTYFYNALLGYYPDTEINSFFSILAEHHLQMSRVDVSLNLEKAVEGKNYTMFQEALERLQKYEPIQYIIGETEFYGLSFKVNEYVLIPRPETEELVRWVLKENTSDISDLKILDIGTGSGCIAISLAKHMPNAQIVALDVSENALSVARENAKNNNVTVEFVSANVLENNNFFENNLGEFHIIVSNPPYVRNVEKEQMKPNVLDHEPHLALFVEGDDPLLFYRNIMQLGQQILTIKGQLYFEINEYLGEGMTQLMQNEGYVMVELQQDLFEKDRMIKGIKS